MQLSELVSYVAARPSWRRQAVIKRRRDGGCSSSTRRHKWRGRGVPELEKLSVQQCSAVRSSLLVGCSVVGQSKGVRASEEGVFRDE